MQYLPDTTLLSLKLTLYLQKQLASTVGSGVYGINTMAISPSLAFTDGRNININI